MLKLQIIATNRKQIRFPSICHTFIEGRDGESNEENTASVSESSSEENTTSIRVSSYEEDSEYISHKNIMIQSIQYITGM